MSGDSELIEFEDDPYWDREEDTSEPCTLTPVEPPKHIRIPVKEKV